MSRAENLVKVTKHPPLLLVTALPEPACTHLTGSEAVLKWIEDVPKNPSIASREGCYGAPSGWTSDDAYADYETCDPCAALSLVALPTAGDPGSSRRGFLLLHQGEYIDAAAKQPIPYGQKCSRMSDDVAQLDGRFPNDGGSTATASDWAISTFTRDEASGSAISQGELSPVHTGTD